MSNEKNSSNWQSAVSGIRAENISIGDINQSIINSSSVRYNHIGVIVGEYNRKIAKLEKSYKDRIRFDQKNLYKQLHSYLKELEKKVEECQQQIEDSQQYLREFENASDTVESLIESSKDYNPNNLLHQFVKLAPRYYYSNHYGCDSEKEILKHIKETEQEKAETEKDIDEFKPLIKLVEGFLRINVLDLDIDQVLDDNSLSNLSSSSRENIESIKDTYKAQQQELEDSYNQNSERYKLEKNLSIYREELQYCLDEDGYPLSLEKMRFLESRLRSFELDEDNVESIIEEIVRPFAVHNLEKYEAAYEDELRQENFPLSYNTVEKLEEIKYDLGLTAFTFLKWEAKLIEKGLVEPFYQTSFQEYQRIYKQELEQKGLVLNPDDLLQLDKTKSSLGLNSFSFKDLDVEKAEQELIELVYGENIQKYQQEYERKLAQEGFPLGLDTISELNRLEKALGLGSFQFPDCPDPVSIKEELTKPLYQANLQAYSNEYKQKLYQFGVNFSQKKTAELEKLRGHFGFDISYLESLGLQSLFNLEEINNIESKLIEIVYRENLQSYEQEYKQRLDAEGFLLSDSTISELTHLEETLGLVNFQIQDCSDVKSIKTKLIRPFYQLSLQNYSQEYKEKLYQHGLDFTENHKFELERLRSNFGLTCTHLKNLDILGQFFPTEADLFAVEKTAKELFYAESLQYYVQEFKREIESNLYLEDQDSKSKESLQKLGIRSEDIKIVEGLVRNNWEIEHLFDERDSEASYWKLINSLAQCEWQKADALTRAILLKLAGASGKGLLDKEAIEKISARDVYTLDRLWVEYSKGRFGFSVQKRIFNEVKQERQKFAEKVGWSDKAGLFGGVFAWKPYNKLNFTLDAPEGHMPIWGAKDQKTFADNFLHLKVWNFEEGNLNSDSSLALVSAQKYYSDEAFWKKVTRFAGKAGEEVIEKVLTLFYAAKQPGIPLGVKLTIITALGYFILPFDFISDLIPIAGWTDDLGALGAALTSAIPYITPEVKEQVKKKMREIFGR